MLAFYLFWVALMPAVFEEWAFRGVLLRGLRTTLPVGWAVATQALLFSIMHLNYTMLLPHFFFGCVAGVMRVVANSLWPCMLWHLLWNAAVVLYPSGLL